ncbi:MAG TPA: hypothetical protein VK905_01570, partial [Bacillota bacterium]|nr:hypothetical protein [Bacillota bacterium]
RGASIQHSAFSKQQWAKKPVLAAPDVSITRDPWCRRYKRLGLIGGKMNGERLHGSHRKAVPGS